MTERPRHSGWTSAIIGVGSVLAMSGVVDAIVTVAAAPPSTTWTASLGAAGLVVALWLLSGLGLGTVLSAITWLTTGSVDWADLYGRLRTRARDIWKATDSDHDRQRVAALTAGGLGAAGWLAGSVLLLAHLIATRHGPLLIAATFVAAQIVLLAVTVLLSWWSRRALSWLLRTPLFARPPLSWIASTRVVVSGAIAAATAGAVVFAILNAQLLRDLDATTWASLGVGALLGAVAGPILGTFLPRRRAIAAALVVAAFALLFGGAQSKTGRGLVVTHSVGAHVLLAQLQALSDVDGDHAPWLPGFDDCGPFDPSRGPLAAELPGDGIDSNCDGADDLPDSPGSDWEAIGEVAIPDSRPDLVLVTIDSWRADTTAAGDGRSSVTPEFDRFANEALAFESAWSQDSGTGPSIWSLMAGKTPFQTKIDSSGRFPPSFLPEETTLAERLQQGGYETNAVLCGAMFAKPHWNIDRGFDHYAEICGKKRSHQAEPTTRTALAKLRELRGDDAPFFLWVHYFDPHRPYTDHDDQDRGESARSKYLEEVHYTDEWLGRLLEELRRGDRRTYVAITADHGEGFGEHGKAPHARTLYREVTHVPLVIWGSDADANRVGTPVAVNDIHPTFLHLAGLPRQHSTMVSHAPVLFGARPNPARLVFQENSFSRPRRHVKGVVGRGHHLLYDSTNDVWEMYDLRDRLQRRNVVDRRADVAEELKAAIKSFIPTTTIPEKLAK